MLLVLAGSAPAMAQSPTYTYFFSQLAFAGGWQTTLTLINYSPFSATCTTNFYSDFGMPLSTPFAQGNSSSRVDTLVAGASIHDQTTASPTAAVQEGWAYTTCNQPVQAGLLYRYFQDGTAVSEASVNGEMAPTTHFVTFAQQATGLAFANPSSKQSAQIAVSIFNTAGAGLGIANVTLGPLEHLAVNVSSMFPSVTAFTGMVQITATNPIISVSLNAEAFPAISSLPPGDLPAGFGGGGGPATYYFSHFAFSGGWQTVLTLINYSPQTVTCTTSFYSDSGTPLPVPFPGGAKTIRTDVLPPQGSLHDETMASLSSPVQEGWASSTCTEPVRASILYRLYADGAAVSEAGVNGEASPGTQFVTFAQQATGVAYANPSAALSSVVTFTAIDSSGTSMGNTSVTLLPLTHAAKNMSDLFPSLANFTGMIEIQASNPIISLSINAEAYPSISSLPPGDLPAGTLFYAGEGVANSGPFMITDSSTSALTPKIVILLPLSPGQSSSPSNTCSPPSSQSNFTTTTRGVNFWFAFENGSAGSTFTVNWIHPSGAVDPTQPTTTLTANGSGCETYTLLIDNSEAAMEPGLWHAVLMVNGSESLDLPFSISGPAITNKTLTGVNPFADNNCTPPPAQPTFGTWSSYAQVWFAFANRSATDTFTVNWIHPSGSIDPNHQLYQINTGSGSGCAGGALSISGSEAASEPGMWSVEVMIDGVEAAEIPFTISVPGVTVTSPAPGSTLTGSTVTFSWTAQQGATSYVLCLGSTFGASDYGCTSSGTKTSFTRTDVPTTGAPLYIIVTAVKDPTHSALTQIKYTEAHIETAGAVLTFPTPIEGATFTPPLILEWSKVPGVTSYLVTAGTMGPGSGNLFSSEGNASTARVSYPLEGETIYVGIETLYPDGVKVTHQYTFLAPNVVVPTGGTPYSGGGSGSGSGGSGYGGSGGSYSGTGGGSNGNSNGWVQLLTCYSATYDQNEYDSDGNLSPTYGAIIVTDLCSGPIDVYGFAGLDAAVPVSVSGYDDTNYVFLTSDESPQLYVCPGGYYALDLQTNSPVDESGEQAVCAPE